MAKMSVLKKKAMKKLMEGKKHEKGEKKGKC